MKFCPAARFARAAAARLMVLMALPLGLPQGVVVLCVGPDSHLFVEFSGGAKAADHGCGCAEECGPCSDVRIGFDKSVSRPTPPPVPDSPPAGLVGPAPDWVLLGAPSMGLRMASTLRWPAAPPPILRSTVLLI